ncbi:MAG: calcium-binding protein [Pseudomonadota bacterium]
MLHYSATDHGFHTLSGVATPIDAAAFLQTGPRRDGVATYDDQEGVWRLATVNGEILLYGDGPDADVVSVDSIRFSRQQDDGAVEIGRLTLDTPLRLDSTPDWQDDAAVWRVAAADALSDTAQGGIVFRGGSGADVFDAGAVLPPVYGPVRLLGRDGDDVLSAGRADAVLRGGAGDDMLAVAGGNGLLFGGTGDDRLDIGQWSSGSTARGGRGDDHVRSSNGDDRLLGNRGDDRLAGGNGDDVLVGQTGQDRLKGGGGDDILRGGKGEDILTGGFGADVFVFNGAHAGVDTITDLDLNEDFIRIRGGADPMFEQIGDDTLVLWAPGDGVRIEDTALAALQDADVFLF